jgi:hypothetical protein
VKHLFIRHTLSLFSLLRPNRSHNSDHSEQETDFEAILDESADQSDLQERADCDAYCRRELPRLVRSHLESAAASQLQALESALRTQLDEIIANCLKRLSASYKASRMTATASNGNGNSLRAPTPMEVQHWHEYNDEADSIPNTQHATDYFTNASQYPDQAPMPSGSAMHDPYGQPDGDLLTINLPLEGIENSKLDSNTIPMCFCPDNACSCPLQRWLGQEQRPCLPPAAVQFKKPANVPRSDPVLGNWNPDDFLERTGSGSDEFDLDLDDDVTFSPTQL